MSSEANPKLYCLRFSGKDVGDDPSKCTALRLKKFNLIQIIGKIKEPLNKAIILNPFSPKILSIDDREKIINYGLIVIDCSWKKLLKFRDFNLENSRKLPPLIAANPINYGKWEKLSSAEAIAAALVIIEFEDFAKIILSKFSWGEEFFKLNYK
jgi:pre-rRNA-processing protein TSR3